MGRPEAKAPLAGAQAWQGEARDSLSFYFGPGILETDRAVKNRRAGTGQFGIHREITEALELEAVSWHSSREGRLRPCGRKA